MLSGAFAKNGVPSTTKNASTVCCRGFFVPKIVPVLIKKPRFLNHKNRSIFVVINTSIDNSVKVRIYNFIF